MRRQQDLVLVAYISLLETKKEKDHDLFPFITERATNRSLSKNREINKQIIDAIIKFAEKGQKVVVLDKQYRDKLTDVSFGADFRIWSDIEFRKEHISWIRNNITRARDGMPGFGVGVGLIPSFFAQPVVLSPLWPKIQAKKNKQALLSTHNFVLLYSRDVPEEWLKLGMLFEKIALFSTKHSLVVSPMGQFIEDDSARSILKTITKEKELEAQMFFRIGYPSDDVHHSPRLTFEHILL